MIGLLIFIASLFTLPEEFSFKNQLVVPFFGEEEKPTSSELEILNKLEENYYHLLEQAGDAKIPKIFHIIWIGLHPFPEPSVKKLERWKKLHPDWKFKFWTESEIHPVPLKVMERHFISQLAMETTRNYLRRTEHLQEISNLLKYEILFAEGGVYLDHDVECLKNIDSLLQFEFFAALEPLHQNSYDRSLISVGNFLIGSIPKSIILESTLFKITQKWHQFSLAYPQTNSFFSDVRSIYRTSLPFTASVLEHFADHSTLILPPLSFSVKQRSDWEDLLKKDPSGRFIYGNHEWNNIWDKKNLDSKNICKMVKSRLASIENLLNTQLVFCFGFLILFFFLRRRIFHLKK